MLSIEEMLLVAGGNGSNPIEEIEVTGYQPKYYFNTFESWVSSLPKTTYTFGGNAGTPVGGVNGSVSTTGTDANKDGKIDEPWELKVWYENGVTYRGMPGRTEGYYNPGY